jgi:hypothetical protein
VSDNPDDIAEAAKIAEKVMTLAIESLAHVEIAMRAEKWRPEFQRIMWLTIAEVATTWAAALTPDAET